MQLGALHALLSLKGKKLNSFMEPMTGMQEVFHSASVCGDSRSPRALKKLLG